jgi:hypothetical protein
VKSLTGYLRADRDHFGVIQLTFLRKADRTLMRSTRCAWLSGSALLVALVLASFLQLQSPPTTASAASTGRVGQAWDPTLQALATQAAVELARAALIPTPNPASLSQAIDQAGAITIHGTLTFNGAVQFSGQYTDQLLDVAGIRPDLLSCASFAQGTVNSDGAGFSVPYPGTTATVDGHSVLIPVSVSNYPGPGDYTGDDVNLGPGVIIDNTNWLVSDDPPAYHVIVNPDGSGSFTFGGLHSGSLNTGTVSAATISGSDVWTCTPRPGGASQ